MQNNWKKVLSWKVSEPGGWKVAVIEGELYSTPLDDDFHYRYFFLPADRRGMRDTLFNEGFDLDEEDLEFIGELFEDNSVYVLQSPFDDPQRSPNPICMGRVEAEAKVLQDVIGIVRKFRDRN